MDTVQILLADDHQMFREGLKTILEEIPKLQVVAQAGNGQEVLTLLKHTKVDLIMLDVHMPVVNGLDCMKQINELYPDLPVIVLTMASDEILIRNLLKAGASGYLLKESSGTDLMNAIEAVLRGDQFFDKRVSQIIMDGLSGQKKTSNSATPHLILTNREIEILKMIAKEESNREIAEKLFISVRTVDAHRRNLLSKIGAKNTAGLTRYALIHFDLD